MIYFILEEENNVIKIGYSKNVVSRLRQLQTSIPYQLRLLGKIEGTTKEERRIHEYLNPYRMKGEWFDYKIKMVQASVAHLISSNSVEFSLIQIEEAIVRKKIINKNSRKIINIVIAGRYAKKIDNIDGMAKGLFREIKTKMIVEQCLKDGASKRELETYLHQWYSRRECKRLVRC